MTNRTGREQIMKRTAIILGIAAAMGVVPSVAAAGNATAQLKPQLKAQLKPQLAVQIFKPQPASPARVTVARATTYRFSTHRISLLRIQSR
ncbi:MAG: hypothetical protein H0U08_08000 [Actinobacteria bacterium]|nr:hypothetical protein [Actinomycetota bacterium]